MKSLWLAWFLAPALACGYIPSNLLAWTHYYAWAAGIDKHLLTAVVWTESRYCTTARSPKGALGLGQLMPATARMFKVDPLHPQQNLYATAFYLRKLYFKTGRWDLALAAYNAGPGNVAKYRGIPPFRETRNYVNRVFSTYRQLKNGS